jgi:hypothetical protein
MKLRGSFGGMASRASGKSRDMRQAIFLVADGYLPVPLLVGAFVCAGDDLFAVNVSASDALPYCVVQ